MHEVDWKGTTPEENEFATLHKVDALLNIAACNLKSECYPDSLSASEEVLQLEPDNIKALQRRAKATYLPVNSSVEDLKKAIIDLKRVKHLKKGHSTRRIDKMIDDLNKKVQVNRKRERDTYSKMFFPSMKAVSKVNSAEDKNQKAIADFNKQAKQQLSVSEYLD